MYANIRSRNFHEFEILDNIYHTQSIEEEKRNDHLKAIISNETPI